MASLEDIVSGNTDEDIDVDFSGALDFGDYELGDDQPAVLESVVPGMSKKQNPKVTWKFVFTDGPNKNRKISRDTPTRGEGSGITRSMLKGFGDDPSAPGYKIRPTKLAGRRCLISIRSQKNDDSFQEVYKVRSA